MPLSNFKPTAPGEYFYQTNTQLKDHVYSRTVAATEAGHAAKNRISTPEGIRRRQKKIRRVMLDAIGGLPSSASPLNPIVTGTTAFEGFRAERLVFESRPANYVTAFLYLPDSATSAAPVPAVLFLSGHHMVAMHHDEYVSICATYARAGFAVLAIDPFGQGERFGYLNKETGALNIDWGVIEHTYAGSQCLAVGDGIARYFVHDAMRAIDYIETRPEIDSSRIAVTGNSGGGTQTSLVMLLEERVAAALPATFIMNRVRYMRSGGAQDSEQIWPGFTANGLDHDDILLAMCPKPVMVLAVKHDFFPLDGTDETVAHARRYWEIFGKSGSPEYFVDDAQHQYTAEMANRGARFLRRHFFGESDSNGNRPARDYFAATSLPESCCPKGQVALQYDDARWVFDMNLDRVRKAAAKAAASPASRDAGIAWLQEKVMNGRKPCALYPKNFSSAEPEPGILAESWLWWSQEDISGHGVLFRAKGTATADIKDVTIALWEKGSDATADHADHIRNATAAPGSALLLLDLSAWGALKPALLINHGMYGFYGTVYKLACDLFWLDDSLAALRVYEILRALDFLREILKNDKTSVKIYAEGRCALYARAAAALSKRISEVVLPEGEPVFRTADWVTSRYYKHDDITSFIMPGILANCPDLA